MTSWISKFSMISLRYLAVFVMGAAGLGIWQPTIFTIFSGHVPLLLAVILFGMGTTLTLPDFSRVAKHPGKVWTAALLQFTIMPLGAWFIAAIFRLPPELAVGLVLLGACPGGTASNVITYLAKGDVPLSVTMTAFSTLLAPLLTPFLVWALAGHWLAIPVGGLFQSLLTIVILPLSAGLACKRLFPAAVKRCTTVLPVVSMLAICLIVGTITGLNADRLSQVGFYASVGILIHNLFGLGTAWTIGKIWRLEQPQLRAITLEVGMQNSGLAATLALAHIHPLAALPGVVASIWQNITGPILATLWNANKKSNVQRA